MAEKISVLVSVLFVYLTNIASHLLSLSCTLTQIAGQRQLLALARGLLRLARSSIVILDEASASLDANTDEQVQKTIRSEMGEATLLCIAHRLRTIIEFDKVLVLGSGKVLEFGEPAQLLADKQSEFSELCRRTGEFDKLSEMARAAHNLRRNKIT